MIILGIDPGLTRTGWGVISSERSVLKFIACGHIKTTEKLDLCTRLGLLSEGLGKILKEYDPDTAAIEETFVNKGVQSALKLGQARGSLILTVAQHKVPLAEYAATLVKKSVTGNGHAEKEQVEAMVKMLLPACSVTCPDEADALAVAITHASHSGFV